MAQQSNPNDTTKILSYIIVALIAFSGGYLVKHLTGKTSGEAPNAEANQGSAAAPSDDGATGESAKIPIGDAPTQGPENAPVTIVEFSDFECPFCEKGYSRMEKLKENYPEDVRVVFKHYPLPFHKKAKPAARAAMAAREQGEEYFWEMHDRLFENQKQWKNSDVAATAAKWAEEMGMDVEQFKKDLENNEDKYNKQIKADMEQGQKLGVEGTPHFLINGEALSGAQPYNKFESVVKDKLDQAEKLLEGGVAKSELYDKAVAKNFDGGGNKQEKEADKKKKKKEQKVSYVPVSDDNPTKGASEDEALVTFVEFSDFQCPFCNKAKPTVQKLRDNYSDKVRFVFKHRPLGFHDQAKPAARAAIAAQQQGKFWEMYDLLFENHKNLNEDNFVKWAEQIGLNVEKFKTAMNSEETKQILQDDIDVANEVGANGTPNFWVNGVNVVGAQPYNKFESVVEQQIEKAEEIKEEKGLTGKKLYKAVAEANEDDIGSAGSAGNDKPSPKKKKAAPEVDTSNLEIGEAPTKGPSDAPITMYVFSEFQCPYCKKAKPTLDKVEEEYGDKIQFVFKHYPLPFHDNAKPAAKAAIAAQKQGKFWEMHDLMFQNQKQLGQDGVYEKWAEQLGLNVEQFKTDMKNVPDSRIDGDMSMGKSVGVKGTPGFFINGKRLVGAQPYNKFKSIIEDELN